MHICSSRRLGLNGQPLHICITYVSVSCSGTHSRTMIQLSPTALGQLTTIGMIGQAPNDISTVQPTTVLHDPESDLPVPAAIPDKLSNTTGYIKQHSLHDLLLTLLLFFIKLHNNIIIIIHTHEL